jgi:hypothetical protein
MNQNKEKRMVFVTSVAVILCLLITPISLTATTFSLQANNTGQDASVSAKDKQVITKFEESVKQYVKLREGLEVKLPKLNKDSTPEQIETHKKAFQEIVRSSRTRAKPGDILKPDISALIRAIIKNEFKGKERQELRQTVFEAETQGVAVRVNYPYPEAKELVEMPPTLLLKLPTLPKQVKYRFVGTQMLLVDRENGLIIDYMPNALP